MSGDNYSSRGMAPSSIKTKLGSGADTDNKAATDSGRHGSSRDYPVSRVPPTLYLIVDSYQPSRDDRRGDRGDRRRSRSPGHRGSRPSRRDGDVDTYSSSRDYREREREDRCVIFQLCISHEPWHISIPIRVGTNKAVLQILR